MDNEYDKATQHHEKYLNIAKQIGDKAGEGSTYGNLGICYRYLGQYNKAIQHHEKSLNIAKQIGNKAGEGRAYANLGICYCSLGQYNKAIQHHEKSLNIAKQIGDKAGEGSTYGNLGICYRYLGQYNKAIQHHEKPLNIAKQIGDKAGEGSTYGNLGNCYCSLGQYNKAIKHHEKSLNIAKQIGDKTGEGSTYGNLGICYCALGQYYKAIQHYEKSLNIVKQIGDKAGEGSTCGNLGICYRYLGQYNKAIQHHEKSLNIAKQIGDKAGEGSMYGNLGNCYCSLGQYHKAIQHHEKSLNIAKQIGDKAGEASTYGNLGNCYCSLGHYNKAIHNHEKSLNIAKQIGDKAGEGSTYGNLGICYGSLGQYDKAELNQMENISCNEELIKNVPKMDEYQISIREKFSYDYKILTRTLIYIDKINEGLVIAEKGRSRALAELMLDSYSVHSVDIIESKVCNINDIKEVVAGIGSTVLFLSLDGSETYLWVIQPSGDIEFKKHSHGLDMAKLKSLISNARMTYRVPCEVKCEDRSLAFLYPNDLVGQTQLKSVLSLTASPEDISATETREFCDCRLHSAAIKKKIKHETVKPTGSATDNKGNIEEKESEYSAFHRLYSVVLGPVRDLITGSRVVIVPEGELHLVPYAALKDDKGQYVADSLQVRLVPSLATARMMIDCSPKSGGRPLIIGDPDAGIKLELPYARKEALEIGQLLNVDPLVGKEATKEKVLQCIENANLIHIAAHGDMKRGEILLAVNHKNMITRSNVEDCMLMASDLENKCLRAKLVVLSCCHSARGEVKSEGVIGIARAFLGAGARSVLVALWALEDEATMSLMKLFYEHLKCGKKANESLSLAMKTLRGTSNFSDPMYWAPFVLIGDDVAIFN